MELLFLGGLLLLIMKGKGQPQTTTNQTPPVIDATPTTGPPVNWTPINVNNTPVFHMPPTTHSTPTVNPSIHISGI